MESFLNAQNQDNKKGNFMGDKKDSPIGDIIKKLCQWGRCCFHD